MSPIVPARSTCPKFVSLLLFNFFSMKCTESNADLATYICPSFTANLIPISSSDDVVNLRAPD